MRKKNNIFIKIIGGLLFFVFITTSTAQIFIKTSTDDTNYLSGNNDRDDLFSPMIWEDLFDNTTKIDTNPPGAGQSDNYLVSSGQVSMLNTYPAWADPAWTKMKPITITNTAGQILTNTVISFAITHEPSMQLQYQDIRFKHQNNPTSWLNYWIESFNTTTAHVWVKVPSIPLGTSYMYLFYGNPSATSQSSYSGVFGWSAFWADDEKTTLHSDNEGTWDPDVSFGNNEFLLAWEEGQFYYLPYTLGYKQEIRASIYDSNGNKVVDDKQVFNDGTLYYRNENPSIDFGDGKYFVAWEHYNTVANPSVTTMDIKARTVVRNGDQLQLGAVLDVCVASNCQADSNVQFDSVNNRFCVVWEDARNGDTNYNVYGRLYDTNGNPIGSEKGISTGTYNQCEPWIAFDPIHEQYMIVWEEGITPDNGPFSVKAGLFDENLNPIGSIITVATGSDAVDCNFPCVEFNSQIQRFLVTWNNDDISSNDWWGNLWGKLYDSSGNVVVNTFQIKSGEYVRTDIVPYFSSSFFISFNSKGTSGSGLIWGKIISSNGELIGGDIQLSTSSSALADWANIAVGNNNVFVGWEDVRMTYPSPWNNNPDIYSNLWFSSIAGSSVTYSVGTEKQLVLSAHVTSVKIIPTNFHHWDIFNATYLDGTITFDVLDGTTGALLLHNILPGSNLFSQGLLASTIRLKATFTRLNPSMTPKLDKWSVKWQTNEPPNPPSNPLPINGTNEVPVTTDLSWIGGDPNGDPVTYDVYFGTSSSPPKLIANQSAVTYDLPVLSYGTTYYWKIIAWDSHSASTIGPVWNFMTNFQPYEPGTPNPSNHSTNIDINADLSWSGGDPDPGDTVTYDVYFGTSNPPPKVQSNQSGTIYNPGIMNYLVLYHWRIVAWDSHGASRTSPVWDFTTENELNNPPYPPSDPQPLNHGTNVDINSDLSWSGDDPDPGDTVTYDVYFGTTNPPPKVISNQSATIYDPGTMMYDTTYYWKIISWDNHDASTQGSIWDFTVIEEPNNPPYPPTNPSPTDGATDVDITIGLSWTGGDPDGDDVTYDIYFGTTSPPIKVAANQSASSYNPGTLEYVTTYFWMIVSWDSHSLSATGDIWQFTTRTEPNNPPYAPDNPSPTDGATAVDVDTLLSWSGGDPDEGDTVTYDIFFGTTSPPPKLVSNHTSSSYQPATLQDNITYYWKIIAWDAHGAFTPGPIWSFTTEVLGDTEPPLVQITKPEKAIYIRNDKVLPFITALVFFAIDVQVTASDNESGIALVEFYVDDTLKANDTVAPYTWTWSEKSFFSYTLKIIAYDNANHHTEKEITVWKFF